MRELSDIIPNFFFDIGSEEELGFLLPHTNNHWFEVFNNHQIYIVIDQGDDLKCYDGDTSYLISELNTDQWYPIEIKAHPSSSSYDVYVDDTLERTCSMWIHGGWENSFRIGDRESTSTDYGEAYWDDIHIDQDISIPTLTEWGIIIFTTLMMGIGVVIIYRRRIA